MDVWAPLATEDPEIAQVIRDEEARTSAHLELIASENYPSLAVLEAMGSILTAKYAEGYPGRRYYGGCEVVDVAENLARDRAKALFGAEHANVQPHAGAQANMAVFGAFLEPRSDDTVLGLVLDDLGDVGIDLGKGLVEVVGADVGHGEAPFGHTAAAAEPP